MALCGCICFSFYGTVWSYLRYLKIDFLSPLEKNEHCTRPGSEATVYGKFLCLALTLAEGACDKTKCQNRKDV